MDEPLDSAINGQDEKGRFAPGNKLGRGNPQAKRMADLRKVFLSAVTEIKVQALEKKLYEMAIEGDIAAFRLYYEYAFGKSPGAVVERDDERAPLVIEAPLPLEA